MRMMHFAMLAILLSGGRLSAAQADEPLCQTPPQLAPEVRERCLATLRKAIQADEFWPAMHAAEALTLVGAGDEVVAELHDRLPPERDDQRRCGLARELVRAGNRSHLPLLFEILSDTNSSGRVHAAESLYKLGESGDGRALRAAFEHPTNPQLWLMAAAALARTGDVKAAQHIREQLGSSNRAIRNTVAFALARLGSEQDVQPLLEALDRESDVVSKAMLACALASLGNTRGRAELIRNLDSPDAAVRAFSAECAGHIRCGECQTKLIRLLDDTTLDVRVRAAQALLVISQPATQRRMR